MRKYYQVLTFVLSLGLMLTCSCVDHSGRHKAVLHGKKNDELDIFYRALFVYYIDNKRFPSNQEGLVYGLVKTGEHAPYIKIRKKTPTSPSTYIYDPPFVREKIIRKSGKSIGAERVKPGDRYLDPFGEVYKYERLKGRIKFDINGIRRGQTPTAHGFVPGNGLQDGYLISNPGSVLKFKNLDKLSYNVSIFSKVRTYSEAIIKNEINFYLKKENKPSNGEDSKQNK